MIFERIESYQLLRYSSLSFIASGDKTAASLVVCRIISPIENRLAIIIPA